MKKSGIRVIIVRNLDQIFLGMADMSETEGTPQTPSIGEKIESQEQTHDEMLLGKLRPHVAKAYRETLERFGPVFKKLAE